MKAVSRWLDRFCYNHPNIGLPGLMKYVAISNLAVYILDMFTNGLVTQLLYFNFSDILSGQIWRLFTFVLVPAIGGAGTAGPLQLSFFFMFLLTTFFYYWIGTTLEQHWGTTRFTVFYLLGILLNAVYGLVTRTSVNMYYINMSMFFSFATLYPDMRVYLYGIIPLKVKWMAWLDVFFFAYDFAFYLTSGYVLAAFMPLVAILNYFIFFWEDLMAILHRGRDRAAHKVDPQTINFKKAQKEVQQRKGYLHKCAVCGITDADDPNMEFRYCSKCSGYYCYCMNHINNHTHVQ